MIPDCYIFCKGKIVHTKCCKKVKELMEILSKSGQVNIIAILTGRSSPFLKKLNRWELKRVGIKAPLPLDESSSRSSAMFRSHVACGRNRS